MTRQSAPEPNAAVHSEVLAHGTTAGPSTPLMPLLYPDESRTNCHALSCGEPSRSGSHIEPRNSRKMRWPAPSRTISLPLITCAPSALTGNNSNCCACPSGEDARTKPITNSTALNVLIVHLSCIRSLSNPTYTATPPVKLIATGALARFR